MREPLRENRHPVNRECKRLLKEAGQSPDPQYLYVLQLARWGLEENRLPVRLGLRDDLESLLDLLDRKKPRVAMRFVGLPGEHDESLSEHDLRDLKPSEAAEEVVELLHRLNQERLAEFRVT